MAFQAWVDRKRLDSPRVNGYVHVSFLLIPQGGATVKQEDFRRLIARRLRLLSREENSNRGR
jgi:hypothetical protein